MNGLMDHPFPKSLSLAERHRRLMEVVNPEDILGIFIVADPDAMASALALKRMFWRKARKVMVYHTNPVRRADNLAFIRLLKIEQHHIETLEGITATKWALVDSQPPHHELFADRQFDIIIDHHPVSSRSRARFVDIRDRCGAASTIMTEYLRAGKIRPSPRLATALFYGIKTDTDNFVRESSASDINAFRYLYRFANTNTIKKIESSEMTAKTLVSYRVAMERMRLVKDKAFIHMDEVDSADTLVLIADFFMRLSEVTWAVVSGVFDDRLIVILRNGGFRGDAGTIARRLFGPVGGSGGGHRTAARAEVPVALVQEATKGARTHDMSRFVMKAFRTAV